jgi:pimeloyl-ACP methyl ester carboxylesterase
MNRTCLLMILALLLALLPLVSACDDGGEEAADETVVRGQPQPGFADDDAPDQEEPPGFGGIDPPGTITDDDDNDDDDTTQPLVGTQYPIVLMHGFFGWGEAGPFSYFAAVADELRSLGFEVYEPSVSPINSMAHRSDQWAERLEALIGDRKFNVISHSQGGLDARYMISTLGWGDRIGAVVMVATPNDGSGLADAAADFLPGWAVQWIDGLLNMAGMDWDGVWQISHEYVRNTFNPANPDDPRVAYYSFATDCGDNCFFLLQPTHAILEQIDGPNDGVVPTEGSDYGEFLGVLPADHWSCIGQPVGMFDFDHKRLYREIAYLLQDEGF